VLWAAVSAGESDTDDAAAEADWDAARWSPLVEHDPGLVGRAGHVLIDELFQAGV
jgi:hypothetical protein